jgi:hypothetical protein
MSTARTYLIPANPESPLVSHEVLIGALKQVGFLGKPIEGFSDAFRFGPEAFRFFGVPREEVDGESSAISLTTDSEIAIITSGLFDNSIATCQCGFKLEDFVIALEVLPWEKEASRPTATCPSCRRENLPWEWKWNHYVGFARQCIEIESGHPTPTLDLMNILCRCSGFDWDYIHYVL